MDLQFVGSALGNGKTDITRTCIQERPVVTKAEDIGEGIQRGNTCISARGLASVFRKGGKICRHVIDHAERAVTDGIGILHVQILSVGVPANMHTGCSLRRGGSQTESSTVIEQQRIIDRIRPNKFSEEIGGTRTGCRSGLS